MRTLNIQAYYLLLLLLCGSFYNNICIFMCVRMRMCTMFTANSIERQIGFVNGTDATTMPLMFRRVVKLRARSGLLWPVISLAKIRPGFMHLCIITHGVDVSNMLSVATRTHTYLPTTFIPSFINYLVIRDSLCLFGRATW